MTKSKKPELIYLSPESLFFDPDNPRFAGGMTGKTQEEIQRALIETPHFASELVSSLTANGFIDYEPLVVKREGNSFVVIEGNRRLAAVKEIRAHSEKYQPRKSNLDQIPAIVFPHVDSDGSLSTVRVYLGVRHMLGFRDWPPLAKAQFLEKECGHTGDLDVVIREIRLTKQQVRRFLVPYRLLRYAKINLPETDDFWVLAEALSRSGVQKFLQLQVNPTTLAIIDCDKSKLRQLLDDLYGNSGQAKGHKLASERKVKDTRDLSTYASVLSSDKAASVLHAGKSLQEAAIYVDTREESLGRLTKISREIGLLIGKLVPGDSSREAATLQSAHKELNNAVKAYVKKNA